LLRARIVWRGVCYKMTAEVPACFSTLRNDPINARSDYNDLYPEASQEQTAVFPSAPNQSEVR
ncbi:MAG TPA: hypothetical protein PL064_05655, partial [Thermogutta sp.]|nr:hypothetical protein [Thermogutta sp.]